MIGPFISHDGGPCPVGPLMMVELQYRAPPDRAKGIRMTVAPACRLIWSHDEQDDDIIAYREYRP